LAGLFADDVQVAAEGVGGPLDQAAGEALVRPDLGHGGVVEACPQQRPFRAVAVLDAGRNDMDGQEQAEGVGDDESLAALGFLASVEAAGATR
jgi:hypothetical protein